MTTQPATSARVELVRRIVRDARQVLDGTMADVTPTQVQFIPPGVANPLGATCAHVVCSEDMIVQGMFRQVAPLSASTWVGRTGLSEPMPMLLANHLGTETGEIAVLKGIQGARGYPM
jgi:hypothetical protein